MITKIKNFINTRNGDTLNPLILTFKKDGVEEAIVTGKQIGRAHV